MGAGSSGWRATLAAAALWLPVVWYYLVHRSQRAGRPSGRDAASVVFGVIGDWGVARPPWEQLDGSKLSMLPNQEAVAQAMGFWAATHAPQFVISTGDHAYPIGLRDASERPRLVEAWEKVYTGGNLAAIPWVSSPQPTQLSLCRLTGCLSARAARHWREPRLCRRYAGAIRLGPPALEDGTLQLHDVPSAVRARNQRDGVHGRYVHVGLRRGGTLEFQMRRHAENGRRQRWAPGAIASYSQLVAALTRSPHTTAGWA
jgi:hypothetical protein